MKRQHWTMSTNLTYKISFENDIEILGQNFPNIFYKDP